MIRYFVTSILTFWFAVAANAQAAQVRAGEHDGFTRIIVDLPSRVDWSIKQVGRYAKVQIKNPGIALDTRTVFNKIPRKRVSEVTWNKNKGMLELKLACKCSVDGFWHGASLLVLDVRDEEAVDQVVLKENLQLPEHLRTIPISDHDTFFGNLSVELFSTNSGEPRSESAGTPANNNASKPEKTINLTHARQNLVRQFGRAASQGLIAPRFSIQVSPDREHTPETRGKLQPAVPEDVKTPTVPQINLKAQTSMDHDFLEVLAAQDTRETGNGCFPNNRINVASWGDEAPFGKQVSQHRLELMGEFDRVNADVALRLSRLYLYFGFGREALQTLELLSPEHPETALMAQLAQIAEYGFVKEGELLRGQLHCDSPAALWSALSYERIGSDLPVNDGSILRSFNALPIHLRSHYGPVLARRFLESDRSETAHKILRILKRPNIEVSPSARLIMATEAISDGELEMAEAGLTEIVESNSEPSAKALATLINEMVKRGDRVSGNMADLAGALAYENQNEPIGASLDLAYVRALASNGSFDQAFSTISTTDTFSDQNRMSEIGSDVFAMLNVYSDDIVFLKHTIGANSFPISLLDSKTSNSVARRLLELGFPQRAHMFVDSDISGSPSDIRERNLLRARIALSQDRPRQAIVNLLGLEDKDASLLRARALSHAGDHSAAYNVYSTFEQDELASHQALLSGDWETVAAYEGTEYRELVSESSDIAPNETGHAILALNKMLLEDSSLVRQTLTGVLRSNPIPEDAN